MAKLEDLQVKVTIEAKPDRRFSFTAGFCLCWCLDNFIQDFLGKESFLRATAASWHNTPFWIWPIIAIAVLALDWGTQQMELARMKKELKGLGL